MAQNNEPKEPKGQSGHADSSSPSAAPKDSVSTFKEDLLRQLAKHGFPDKAVAFPVDAVFEAASRKGFSFNKVRDLLAEQGILSELEEARIVFRKADAPEPVLHDDRRMPPDFDAAAAEVLANVSPEDMQRFREMLRSVSPSDMAAMKAQLDAMSEADKIEMMQKMKEVFGKK